MRMSALIENLDVEFKHGVVLLQHRWSAVAALDRIVVFIDIIFSK
jgi:hypothetical protein